MTNMIVQHGGGRCEAELLISGPVNIAWAKRHNFGYMQRKGRVTSWPQAQFDRYALLLNLFEGAFGQTPKTATWLDADCFFQTEDNPWEEMPKTAEFGAVMAEAPEFCPHCCAPTQGAFYESGVMLLRNTPRVRRLLRAVVSGGPIQRVLVVAGEKGTLAGPRDERRLNYEMKRIGGFKAFALDNAWNRRVFHKRYQKRPVKIAAFHGYTPAARSEYMRIWLNAD
jgi:hypothetical protein